MVQSLMINLFWLIACLVYTSAAELGDVNAGGNVDIVDTLMTARYCIGLGPAGFDPGVADVDGSGAVTIVVNDTGRSDPSNIVTVT